MSETLSGNLPAERGCALVGLCLRALQATRGPEPMQPIAENCVIATCPADAASVDEDGVLLLEGGPCTLIPSDLAQPDRMKQIVKVYGRLLGLVPPADTAADMTGKPSFPEVGPPDQN